MNYTFNKKLVEQLRNGEICAYFNRGKDSLEMLQALCREAWPDRIEPLGICKYYHIDSIDTSGEWVYYLRTDKTPIPLSNFVQPEQSERDVMAELDERLKRLEDILLRDNEPCKAEPEIANSVSLKPIIEAVLEKYHDKVAEYKSGKNILIGLFMGEIMKLSKGKADPSVANELLIERIKEYKI